MNESSEIEQQLWELVYGLLSEEETRELQQRIRSDRQLARKYAEICLQADLVASASKLPAPPAELSVSAIDPTSKPAAKSPSSTKKPAPSASVSRKSAVQPWIDRGLLVLAASLLLLMVGVGPQALKKIDTASVAYQYPSIKMTTDRPMIEAISSQLKVSLSDATGKPMSRPTRAQVVTPMGEVTDVPVTPGRELGELSLPLARNVVVPGSKLQVHVEGLPQQEIPLPIQTNPVEDVVVLEKPIASPGETLHFFAYGRHAIGGEITKPSADSVQLFGSSAAKDAKQAADPMFDAPAENHRKFLWEGEVVKGEITIPKETALGLAAVSLEKSGLPVAEQPVLIVAPEEQQLASRMPRGEAQSLAIAPQERKAGESLERFQKEGIAKKAITAPAVRSQPEAGAAAPPPPLSSAIPAPANDAVAAKPNAPQSMARSSLPPGAPSPSALGAMPPSGGSRAKEDELASGESASGKENAMRRLAQAKGGAIAEVPGVGGPASGQFGMKRQSLHEKESSGEFAKSKLERISGEKSSGIDQVDPGMAGGGLGGGSGNRDYDTEEKMLAEAPTMGRWLRRGSDANVVLPVPEVFANLAKPIQVDIRSGNEVIASQFFDATQIQDGNISVPVPAEVPPPLTAQFFGGSENRWFTVDVPASSSSALDRLQIAGRQDVYQPGKSVEMTIEPPTGEWNDFEVLGVQVVQTDLLTDVFRFSGSESRMANSRDSLNRSRMADKRTFNAPHTLDTDGNRGALAKAEKASGPNEQEPNSLEESFPGDHAKNRSGSADMRDGISDKLSVTAQSPVLLWDTSLEMQRNFQSEVDQLKSKRSTSRTLFDVGIVGFVVVALGLVANRFLTSTVASPAKTATRTTTSSVRVWSARQYWGATAAFAALVMAMVIWWPNGPMSRKMAVEGVGSANPEAKSMAPGMPPAMAPAAKPDVAGGEVQDFVSEERLAAAKSEREALSNAAPPRELTESATEKLPSAEPFLADAPPAAMDDSANKDAELAPQGDERKSKLREKVAIPLSLYWMTPDPKSGSERIPIRFTLPEAEADYTLIVHAVENGQPVTKQVPIVIRHPALAKEASPSDPAPAEPAPASEPKPAPPQPK